jgi:phosphoribosylformimino-5-aminoimidazole carboxamide ribotide isomerase
MTIIPAIDLKDGKCVNRFPNFLDGKGIPFSNPLKMAKLWRIQNACSLWIYDHDAAAGNPETNEAVIAEICASLDIPIGIAGGFSTLASVRKLRKLGIFRVMMSESPVQNPEIFPEAVAEFGATHLGVYARIFEGKVYAETTQQDPIAFAKALETQKCLRLMLTVEETKGGEALLDVPLFTALGNEVRRMKVGTVGGIHNLANLQAAAKLPRNVDIAVVGRALYDGRFPCQKFWAWHQKENLDLDCYSTAVLR